MASLIKMAQKKKKGQVPIRTATKPQEITGWASLRNWAICLAQLPQLSVAATSNMLTPDPPVWVDYSDSLISIGWASYPNTASYAVEYTDSKHGKAVFNMPAPGTLAQIDCLSQNDGRAIDVKIRTTSTSQEESEWSQISTFYCRKNNHEQDMAINRESARDKTIHSEDTGLQKPRMPSHKQGYHRRKLYHDCWIDDNLFTNLYPVLNAAVTVATGTSQVFGGQFSNQFTSSNCPGGSSYITCYGALDINITHSQTGRFFSTINGTGLSWTRSTTPENFTITFGPSSGQAKWECILLQGSSNLFASNAYTLDWDGTAATLSVVQWNYSDSPPVSKIPTPTWTGSLSNSSAYLWMKQAVTMSLPVLNEADFKSTSTYAHTFHAIPLATYNTDAACRPGGSGECYNSYNFVTVSGFSINSTNLSAVTFTVPAGENDRNKIDTWQLAHKIVKISDLSVVWFKCWSFQINDACDNTQLTWIFTSIDSSTEITAANTDITIIKTAQYRFSDSTYFDTSAVYDMLSNSPSTRPCFDLITNTISSMPTGILQGSSSIAIKASSIPTGDAQLISITFSVTFSNSVNPGTSSKTFQAQTAEFMLGHCARTLNLDLNYTYASQKIIITHQIGPSLTWPAQAFSFGAGGRCGGTYVQTYDCNGSVCPQGVTINSSTRTVSINSDTTLDAVTFSLKLASTWTIGVAYPQTYTDSKVITLQTTSLWNSVQLSTTITPTSPLNLSAFTVDQIHSTQKTQKTFGLAFDFYTQKFIFIKDQLPFQPEAIKHATETLVTSTYTYKTGSEYPIVRQEGTPKFGSKTWDSSNPATFICPMWTIQNSGTIEHVPVSITNSLDSNLMDTIKGPCSFAACSNKVAYELGDLNENSGQIQRFSDVFYDIGSAAVSVKLQEIKIFCKHQPLLLLQAAKVTYPNDSSTTLDENKLVRHGISIDQEKASLLIFSDDTTLADAVFDIQISSTIKEEPDWANTNLVRIKFNESQAEACFLTKSEISSASSTFSNLIELVADQQGIQDTFSLSEMLTKLTTDLGLEREPNLACGPLTISEKSPYPFLIINERLKVIQVKPQQEDAPNTYKAAKLSIFLRDYPELGFQVPIKVTIKECIVQQLSFKSTAVFFEYNIGFGPLVKDLPELQQKPDCGFAFNSFSLTQISSSLTQDQFNQVVFLDSNKLSLTIDSSDFSLIGQTIQLKVQVDSLDNEKVLSAKDLLVEIKLLAAGPQFNLAGFEITPITCSSNDAIWSLKLPPVIDPEIQTVAITMESSSEENLLTYVGDSKIVFIAKDKKNRVSQGLYCPQTDQIIITFKLLSNVLGEGTQELQIPVKPKNKAAFGGGQFDQQSKYTNAKSQVKMPEQLKVSRVDMQFDGRLTIVFSKSVFWPNITISEAQDSPMKRSLVQQSYSIQDIISIRVKDTGEEESLQKKNLNFTLEKIYPLSLELKVVFENPSEISTDIKEPDTLIIEFIQPGLVIDAETFDQLKESQLHQESFLQPQMTSSQAQKLYLMVKAAATVGGITSIWEIVACFFLGKAIHAMWGLVNTMQFLILISKWQVPLSPRPRITLKELRRVILGEFFDDLDLGSKIASGLGFAYDKKDNESPAEKVGLSRLGKDDLFENLGATFIIFLIIFLVAIFLVLLIICVSKKCASLSLANKRRIDQVKRKIFFNPLIRYVLLNTLKMNMTATVAITGLSQGVKQMAISITTLIVLNLLPFLFAKVLHKNRETLESEATIAKYGTLYEGMSVKETLDSPPRQRHIWIQPLIFMFRRTLFIVLTVLLFDYPVIQMIGHCLLTLLTAIYVSQNSMYTSRSRQAVEIGNEMLLLLTSQLIQQCMKPMETEQLELMGDVILASLILLCALNVTLMIYTIIIGCKQKYRARAIEASKAAYLDYRRQKLMEMQKKGSAIDSLFTSQRSPEVKDERTIPAEKKPLENFSFFSQQKPEKILIKNFPLKDDSEMSPRSQPIDLMTKNFGDKNIKITLRRTDDSEDEKPTGLIKIKTRQVDQEKLTRPKEQVKVQNSNDLLIKGQTIEEEVKQVSDRSQDESSAHGLYATFFRYKNIKEEDNDVLNRSLEKKPAQNFSEAQPWTKTIEDEFREIGASYTIPSASQQQDIELLQRDQRIEEEVNKMLQNLQKPLKRPAKLQQQVSKKVKDAQEGLKWWF